MSLESEQNQESSHQTNESFRPSANTCEENEPNQNDQNNPKTQEDQITGNSSAEFVRRGQTCKYVTKSGAACRVKSTNFEGICKKHFGCVENQRNEKKKIDEYNKMGSKEQMDFFSSSFAKILGTEPQPETKPFYDFSDNLPEDLQQEVPNVDIPEPQKTPDEEFKDFSFTKKRDFKPEDIPDFVPKEVPVFKAPKPTEEDEGKKSFVLNIAYQAYETVTTIVESKFDVLEGLTQVNKRNEYFKPVFENAIDEIIREELGIGYGAIKNWHLMVASQLLIVRELVSANTEKKSRIIKNEREEQGDDFDTV